MATLGIKGGQLNWGKIIKVVLLIALIVASMIFLFGCRTVKSSSDKEQKQIDTTSIQQHDTSSKRQSTDLAELISAKNFHITIVFDSAHKLNTTPTIKKPGSSGAISFLENLIAISNQNVKSIDISANDFKDSSHSSTSLDSIGSSTKNTIHKQETDTKAIINKSVKSNTNLLIVSGILIFLLAIFYAVFTYFKKTTGSIFSSFAAIKNFFK